LSDTRAQTDLKLWYDRPIPTDHWHRAFPIGNGRLGGMVFGGVGQERIQLNEDTLWSGFPRETNNPEAIKHLQEARELVFAGKYLEAEKVVETHMLGPWNESYQPLGDLNLTLEGVEDFTNYHHELDLTTATTLTYFESAGRIFTRQSFVSAVDQVLAVKLDCDKPGQFTGKIALSSPLHGQASAGGPNTLVFKGVAPSHVEPNYVFDHPNPVVYTENESLSFEIRLQVLNEGGEITFNENNELEIKGADRVTLLLSGATNFEGFDKQPAQSQKDPAADNEKTLSAARSISFEELHTRHLADFQPLFNRVEVSLGTTPHTALPTDQRLEKVQAGEADPQLYALYYQYSRYLLICGSRPGTQAAGLQSIWNEEVRPPWSGNYTININTQMNYWPAESGNLSETHLPLVDLLEEMRVNGTKTAQVHYGARGWTAHHNVDLWRQTAPAGGSAMWAFWPMGGAWLSQHLWEHYAFTLDRAFLTERAYPLLKEAALFCLDWLIDDGQGNLVTNPATSPENRFLTPAENEPCAVSQGSTADLVMITDLFNHVVEASRILEIDADFRGEVEAALARMNPFKVGKFGQLQEWFQDFDEWEPGHRHTSHLFSLYPAALVNRHTQPELTAAARNSIQRRFDEGGATGGWSCAWAASLFARLGNGEQAYRLLERLLVRTTSSNLFNVHGRREGGYLFQIDGNFGGGAALAEMLLQSQNGEIEFLPAIPAAWSEGSFSGMKARGNFEVSATWAGNALTGGQVRAAFDGPCRVRSTTPIKGVTSGEAPVSFEQVSDGVIEFQTKAAQTYRLAV